MNYRHAFHAGNHADVLKHVVLARVLEHLRLKDKPFAVLDAHAGIGRYDLKGAEALKTQEWKVGIARLVAAPLPEEARNLCAIYLNILKDMNPDGALRHYPGSPEIIARLLRRGDRMIFNELHPQDADTLASRYGADKRVQVTRQDASQSVKAALPFKERRGLLLLDPAYEDAKDWQAVPRTIRHAMERMANTTVLAWYPLKTEADADELKQALAALDRPGTLCTELLVREPFAEGGLAGSGLAIVNPPFTLREELAVLLPVLAERLGKGTWGRGRVTVVTQPA
jgi:23S rRNA (adenine2030-N6)-methyltransferase